VFACVRKTAAFSSALLSILFFCSCRCWKRIARPYDDTLHLSELRRLCVDTIVSLRPLRARAIFVNLIKYSLRMRLTRVIIVFFNGHLFNSIWCAIPQVIACPRQRDSPLFSTLTCLGGGLERGGRTYYRLNGGMVVKWLQAKANRIKNHLERSPDIAATMRSGARAANYQSTPMTNCTSATDIKWEQVLTAINVSGAS